MSRSRKNISINADSLSNLERLLISQAVYEFGSNAWPDVAKVVSTHPLIHRPKQFFTPESCDTIYKTLIEKSGIDLQTVDSHRHSVVHKTLAQGHYAARVIELKSLIETEEAHFRALVTEIEEIRAGKWDARITQELGQNPIDQEEPEEGQEDQFTRREPVLTKGPKPDAREAFSEEAKRVVMAPQSPVEDDTQVAARHVYSRTVHDEPYVHVISRVEPVVQESRRPANEEVFEAPPQLLDYPSSPPAEEESAQQTDPTDVESEDSTVEGAVAANVDEDEPEVVPRTGTDDALLPESLSGELGVHMNGHEAVEAEAEVAAEIEEAEAEDAQPDITMIPTPPPSPPLEQDEPEAQAVALESEEEVVEEEAILLPPSIPPSHHREKWSEYAGKPEFEGEAEVANEVEAQASKETKGAVEELVPEAEAEMQTRFELAIEVEAKVEPGGVEEGSEVVVGPIAEGWDSAIPESLPALRSEGKRKVSDADLPDTQRESKRIREASEATEEEESSSSTSRFRRKSQAPAEGPVVSKRFQNVIGMLHSTISQHRYGNIFHNPIKKSEAPDYHDIVKRPIDLKTIKARVKDGIISNSLEFQRDVYLMFANAMMYNRPGSEIYNMAEEMMLESEVHIKTFRQTEGFHRG